MSTMSDMSRRVACRYARTWGVGALLGAIASASLGAELPARRDGSWFRPSAPVLADGQSQPPPPAAGLLHALAWWYGQGHGPVPTALLRHLSTFVPVYLAYSASDEAKAGMPFEVWLTVNGFSDPALCEGLVELYRLAE